MAGGSGLFVRAVTDGFDELPAIDPEIRKKLNQDFEKNGIEFLQQQLKIVDPEYFNQVDLANPQRIIRSLEVYLATKTPYSTFRKGTTKDRNFTPIKIGLTLPREKLYARINSRVDEMISNGLVEEATNLFPFKHYNSLQTVGYTEIFNYLEGKTSLIEAVDKIKQNSRRLAKRQLTWFTKDSEINWFQHPDLKKVVSLIEQKIEPK